MKSGIYTILMQISSRSSRNAYDDGPVYIVEHLCLHSYQYIFLLIRVLPYLTLSCGHLVWKGPVAGSVR